MYIRKAIMTEFGIPAEYHTLKEIHTYYNSGVSHINIAGYFSEDAYNNGVNAIVINQIEVNKTNFESQKDIYNAVLESVVFQDGVLCEEETTQN